MKRGTVGSLVFVATAFALGTSPAETPALAEAGTGPSLPAAVAPKSDVTTAETTTEAVRAAQRSVVKGAELDATTDFSAAVFADARDPETARRFVKVLRSPAARQAYIRNGLKPFFD